MVRSHTTMYTSFDFISKEMNINNNVLNHPDVFTGQLRLLIGHYLPIFDCIPNMTLLTDEWLKFFRFKTESFNR